MIANKILYVVDTIISTILIPVQLVSTFVLGALVTLSLGLLMYPIALVWLILSTFLVFLSFLSSVIPGGRFIIGLLGIPLALVSSVYVQLMPSMGELESRASHLMLCETWPYSFEYWQFLTGRTSLEQLGASNNYFPKTLSHCIGKDPLRKKVVERIMMREPFDSEA